MTGAAARRPVLSATSVSLRPPRERDKRDRLSHGRDPEFRRMVGGDPRTCPPLTAEDVDRWYADVCDDRLCWTIDLGGRCIGTARLHSLDQQNRRARYAIGIFHPSGWGKGYGTEATQLVLRHAFEQLKLHRVELRVLAFNHRAIACYEKCGFVREGVERDALLVGGEWQDDVIMSILEREFRREGHGAT